MVQGAWPQTTVVGVGAPSSSTTCRLVPGSTNGGFHRLASHHARSSFSLLNFLKQTFMLSFQHAKEDFNSIICHAALISMNQWNRTINKVAFQGIGGARSWLQKLYPIPNSFNQFLNQKRCLTRRFSLCHMMGSLTEPLIDIREAALDPGCQVSAARQRRFSSVPWQVFG